MTRTELHRLVVEVKRWKVKGGSQKLEAGILLMYDQPELRASELAGEVTTWISRLEEGFPREHVESVI